MGNSAQLGPVRRTPTHLNLCYKVRKVETQNKQLIARKDELKAQLATATAKAHAARKVEELNARLVARNEVLECSLKSASGGANSNEGVEQRVQEQLLECTQRINALSKEKRRLRNKKCIFVWRK